MAYVQRGLNGLSRVRFENGDESARYTGFVAPAPIIGQTVQPVAPLPIEAPLVKSVIIGGNGTSPIPISTYGRGFVPSVRDVLTSFIHPPIPGAPTFEVDDSRIVPNKLLPSLLPAETRVPIVSEPTDAARAKLAFELAEAEKWGYTHSTWMALGATARMKVRAQYPEGHRPVTRDGVSVEAARIDFVAGRDPARLEIHESGAGDYPGGIEIANPQPTVPLVSTRTGVTFDDVLRVDPVKVQTAEEAAGIEAGVFEVKDVAKYAIYGFCAWILWDVFGKKQKRKPRRRRKIPPMRRQYPYAGQAKRFRQGYQ